jgi:hypothetical protein
MSADSRKIAIAEHQRWLGYLVRMHINQGELELPLNRKTYEL